MKKHIIILLLILVLGGLIYFWYANTLKSMQSTDINRQDKNGRTTLHYAVMSNNLSQAAQLLSQGAKLDIKDNDGKTPVDYATTAEMRELLAKYIFADWQWAPEAFQQTQGPQSSYLKQQLEMLHKRLGY